MRYRKTTTRLAIAAGLALVMVLAPAGCGKRSRPSPTATATPTAATQAVPTATPADPTPRPSATATAAPTASPEPTPSPRATFEEGPCPFGVPQGAAVDCGYVVVPEDHGVPDGATLKLAVVVFRDQSEDHRPDPLVLLAGGPGERVVEVASQTTQFLSLFAGNRDVVLFDQRGVGRSEPALDCPELVAAAFDLLDEVDPETSLEIEFDALTTCRDRLVAEGHNLSAYTTAQSAADVGAIREALGYEEVNLYGGSYGSFLAQATMRSHPEGIRSVVLESVWPIETSLLIERLENGARMGLKLIDACTSDPECAAAYPDLETVFFDVIDRLNAEPVPMTIVNPADGRSYEAMLTGDAVYGVLLATFYQTQLIPALPQAIYDVSNGDYGLMAQLSGARLMLLDLTSSGMAHSVLCAEDLIGHTVEEFVERREALPSQLRGRADAELAARYGAWGVCEEWPVDPVDESFKEPVTSDIPTLVIAGEYDAVTPPEYARAVAGRLSESTLFEIPGAGHGGDTTGPCAVSIIANFLEAPTSPPDGTCVADLPPLAFDLPKEAVAVALEPWSSEDIGLGGLVPGGWQEVQPGVFVRGSSALDQAVLQIAVVPIPIEQVPAAMAQNYGLDDLPESTGQREANGLTWTLFSFEVAGARRDLAAAGDGGVSYILVVGSPQDEREVIYADVFLPMVDALAPID